MDVDVSVIIPVYNVELYLQECLDSVLSQSGCSFEVICIDDGSTDSSPQILQTAAQKDPRIRIITQQNGGLSAARNSGMSIAKGRYLSFVDSDDLLKENALAQLVMLADRKHLDHIVIGTDAFIDNRSGLVDPKMLTNGEEYYRIKDESIFGSIDNGVSLFCRLIRANSFYATAQLRFLRRSTIQAHNLMFVEGLIHEDNHFTPLALMAADRAVVIPDKHYNRRLRGGSIMTAPGTGIRHAAGCLAVVIKLKTAFGRFNVSEAETGEAISSYLTLLLEYGETHFSQVREVDAEKFLVRELEKTCSTEEINTLQWLVLPLLRQANAARTRAQKYYDKRFSVRVKKFFRMHRRS